VALFAVCGQKCGQGMAGMDNAPPKVTFLPLLRELQPISERCIRRSSWKLIQTKKKSRRIKSFCSGQAVNNVSEQAHRKTLKILCFQAENARVSPKKVQGETI